MCIPAAELECTWEGVQLHILSYGADPSDPRLMGLAARNREILDGMSDTLIERMIPEHPKLSLEGFRAFSHDRSLGGWKGLHYLHSMGVTRTPKEGAHLYARYDVLYENAGFPDLSTLLDAIHGAGGKAVLAHPGYTLKALDEDEMEHRVRELIDWGLDGLECYYPLHDAKMTRSFRSLCLEKDLLITAGSDCHGSGAPGREMDITLDQIRLRARKLANESGDILPGGCLGSGIHGKQLPQQWQKEEWLNHGILVLYRTWRPTCFGDVVGQELIGTLAHQMKAGISRLSVCGTRGRENHHGWVFAVDQLQ